MKFYEICFSPTGGTKKAADMLAEKLAEEIQSVDLTDYKTDFSGISLEEDDEAIIAVPSYGGRVPETAVKRLSLIKGNQAKAILVCVYGNRAYEDTLVELEDTSRRIPNHSRSCRCSRTFHCPPDRSRTSRFSGSGTAYRLCRKDPGKTLFRKHRGTCYSRQSSV